MERIYRYMVIELKGIPDDDGNSLDAYGRAGYELVAVIQAPDSDSQKPKLLAYLKNIGEWEKIPNE